jgi:hypothetical protein
MELLLDGNKQWFCLNSENSQLAAIVAGALIVALLSRRFAPYFPVTFVAIYAQECAFRSCRSD